MSSREWLQKVLERSHLALVRLKIILDEKGEPLDYVFVEVNRSFEEMIGLKREEFLNRPLSQMVEHFSVGRDLIKTYDEIALNGYSKTLEVYVSNLKKWYSVEVISAEKGYFTTLFTEITENKRKDKAMLDQLNRAKEEYETFKAVADKSLWGVAIADMEGNLLYVNDYFANAHGYTPDELMGKNLFILHNDEQKAKVEDHLKQLMQTGHVAAKEIWHAHRDSSVFPMLMGATIISDPVEGSKYIAATALDISEWKKNEQLYQTLFNASADAIMTFSTENYRFISANPATVKLFHAKTEEDLLKFNPWDLSPERQSDGVLSSEKAKKVINQAMEKGSYQFEWDHLKLNGEGFLASVLLNKIELESGHPIVMATVRD